MKVLWTFYTYNCWISDVDIGLYYTYNKPVFGGLNATTGGTTFQ